MRIESLQAGCVVPAICCLVLVGCGPDRPEMATVTGKVTYRGAPVPEGQIMFYPENGRMASGAIAADGTYELTTYDSGDGALLGRHVVTITSRRVSGGRPEPKTFEEEVRTAADKNAPRAPAVKVTWLAPEKYSDRRTSPLAREVQRGENVCDFDLSEEN